MAEAAEAYDSSRFMHLGEIALSPEAEKLMVQASRVYAENFDGRTWYGRGIFISWHCPLDCTFCFRSAPSHKGSHPEQQRRSMGSLLLEALFCRVFRWRIEFLTGGYNTMPFDQLLEVARNVAAVYGEKIWLNMGVLSSQQLERCKPFVKGICSSMETLHPELHAQVCPKKPIQPYEDMMEKMDSIGGLKKSIAVIVGLGDTIADIHYLHDFIRKHRLDRITLYALKPVKGSPFTRGPSVEDYVRWIARIRIQFPALEIIAGTNLRRCEEAGYLIRAGANAVTKFPATKQFATKKAKLVEKLIRGEGREFISNLTVLPEIDWNSEIDALEIEDSYKEEMKKKLPLYLKSFQNPADKDPDMDL